MAAAAAAALGFSSAQDVASLTRLDTSLRWDSAVSLQMSCLLAYESSQSTSTTSANETDDLRLQSGSAAFD